MKVVGLFLTSTKKKQTDGPLSMGTGQRLRHEGPRTEKAAQSLASLQSIHLGTFQFYLDVTFTSNLALLNEAVEYICNFFGIFFRLAKATMFQM